MTIAAVIVAAGRGRRAGGAIPKQYQPLCGIPVLARSIQAFTRHSGVSTVVVVLHPDDAALFDTNVRPHLVGDILTCNGGAERAESVLCGLWALSGAACKTVLIHDGARPLVSADLIDRVIDLTSVTGAAAPALEISDTIWRGVEGNVSGTLDRSGLYRAQTPQGFDYGLILQAHEGLTRQATDDVEVARAAGIDVAIVKGDEANLKITQAIDFSRAEILIGGQMDIRTGNGFDVHAFEKGDHVILCGIPIPHNASLKGHSDADVAMHAITDALYGALARGDIGQWFPPSDPNWKGAGSDVFLTHAVTLAKDEGYKISNLDCTIICENPKIGPHANTMRENLARIVGIDVGRISVKATTSEKLGFTGRGEGIAAQAGATLVKS